MKYLSKLPNEYKYKKVERKAYANFIKSGNSPISNWY